MLRRKEVAGIVVIFIVVLMSGLIAMFFLWPDKPPVSPKVMAQQEDRADLVNALDRVAALEGKVAGLETQLAAFKTQVGDNIVDLNAGLARLREDLEIDPSFSLRLIDRDLNTLEQGHGDEVRGSFTDFFIPTLSRAFGAGAKKGEVEDRINRAVALAEKGLFLSSFEEGLVKESGPAAVRKYAFKEVFGE